MASYTEKKAQITEEIDKMNAKVAELVKKREALLVEEAVRYTEAAQPSAATKVAQALLSVHNEHDVSLEVLFGPQTPEVNTAGLLLQAEYRNACDIEMFLENGADVNAKDNEGFSVLDMVLQGHGYNYRFPDYWNKEVLDVLAEYNVERNAVEGWIIKERCVEAPQYVRDFLGLDV